MNKIMDRLRELREAHDYTQKDIAAVLNIKQQHYSKYETGEYELPLRHFVTLAEYYGVSADYLIGRDFYSGEKPLDMIYITRNCSCEQLMQNVISLSEQGREAVVEYAEVQKLKEAHKKALGKPL